MSKKVTVIDYGMGNLLSVRRALEHCGAQVEFADTASGIASADKLVLPGVGACGDGMANLHKRQLVKALRDYAQEGKLLLGICLGMQMLFDVNEEFGTHQALGVIAGKVAAIPRFAVDGKPHKIPHIGWSKLSIPNEQTQWQETILSGLDPGSYVYFVHSYTAIPENEENRLADCEYNQQQISAVVKQGNLYGCQFHPEKSGPIGLRILNNFVEMN